MNLTSFQDEVSQSSLESSSAGSAHASQTNNDNDDDDMFFSGSFHRVKKTKKSKHHGNDSDDDSSDDDDDTAATSAVSTSRLIAALCLAALSIAISFSIAFSGLAVEDQLFHEDFVTAATTLLNHVGRQGHAHVDTLATLGLSMTSSSSSSTTGTTTWPNVHMTAFDDFVGPSTVDAIHGEAVVWAPRVTDPVAWETYATETYQPTTGHIFSIAGVDSEEDATRERVSNQPVYYPVAQAATTTTTTTSAWNTIGMVNFDLTSLPTIAAAISKATTTTSSSTTTTNTDATVVVSPSLPVAELQVLMELGLISPGPDGVTVPHEPIHVWVVPVWESVTSNTNAVGGVLVAFWKWTSLLQDAFVQDAEGLEVVLQHPAHHDCQGTDATFTYMVNDAEAIFQGVDDLHTTYYTDMGERSLLTQLIQESGFVQTVGPIPMPLHDATTSSSCTTTDKEGLQITITPSPVFMNTHTTDYAFFATLVTMSVLAFMFLLFLLYIGHLQQQVGSLVQQATQSRRLVNALFPQKVQDRLFQTIAKDERQALLQQQGQGGQDPLTKAKAFLTQAKADDHDGGIPIADLWTDCTVLFADIKGFTAWSACRAPTQVFQLLETLFKEFDKHAKKRGVFKVETIGDCYVAVIGLPNPCKNHAVVMSRFANDIRRAMMKQSKELEVALGPDTGDLEIRIGLHSGPVTAGVLRGEKGRFQLFGDTVNCASRMESNGMAGKIHASAETAKLLQAAGKDRWVTPREDRIDAKGYGSMQTFWIEPSSSSQSSIGGASNTFSLDDIHDLERDTTAEPKPIWDSKSIRLVDWNVQVLSQFLADIVNRRGNGSFRSVTGAVEQAPQSHSDARVIDEFHECVEMLPYEQPSDDNKKELSEAVKTQLREYVTTVCGMYRGDNPFHNFEHASHVTMSVVKLIQRVVAPTGSNDESTPETLHTKSYGLSGDPLTQFACVFAALIHDVDHPGVPNAQLINENSHLAKVYKNKSMAEQNSVDIAWDLLQMEGFVDLRNAICETQVEQRHFRQLVVNCVMATDIVDKEWKTMRETRWSKAFSGEDNSRENLNRKATIVIEHMLQASDIAHTMQHWHIYRKWNERLFMEMVKAHKEGRAEKNPADFWYEGEIGFFDFYIIPLAKKLHDCGVFGVSSKEYLTYAEQNRTEWEQRGKAIVQEYVEKIAAGN